MDTDILLAIVSLLALLLAALGQLQLRQARRQLRQGAEQARVIRALREDVGALCAGASGVGERMTRLEQRVRRQDERQDQLELRGGERSYDEAIRLVEHGADAEQLVKSCGLAPGEADLLVRLHGLDKAG